MFVWKKLASAKWEDAWIERLSFVGPARLVVAGLPGAKTIRIEACGLTKSEADQLWKRFGGQVRRLQKHSFVSQNSTRRDPIRIRKKLLIVSSERDKQRAAKKFPHRKILLVPAAMAFGTGEHATTASCLRFLSDASDALRGESWDLLDLGTGSGILAIAGRMFGARKAEAFDFDPHAVRTARENIRSNSINSIAVKKLDVLKWKPLRTWDVVTANLFSEVLIAAAPSIARALRAGGTLIFSGILRAQENDCVRAFRKNDFRIEALARRGKWVTCLAKKSVS